MPSAASHFETIETPLRDGVVMRLRRYAGGDARTPAICIPGLTRNAADFEDFAPRLAATGRDVLVANLRGRGASDRDPNYLNYHPLTYRDDILQALDAAKINRAVFVGTSLGGIVTMLTHLEAPSRVAAAIINDVGPDLAPEGIARIAGYVGDAFAPASTIEEAASRVRAINAVAFPEADEVDWIKFALRTFRRDGDHWIVDYDPGIAKALAEVGPAPDLWPAWESLRDKPTLVIRGAISDLLSPAIVDKMRSAHPEFAYAEAPNIGHAPMLTDAASWPAIRDFLRDLK